MGFYLGELKIEQDCVVLTSRLIEISSADMLRIERMVKNRVNSGSLKLFADKPRRKTR